MRGNTKVAPHEGLTVMMAKDFGCLPCEVEEKMTDAEVQTWVLLKAEEQAELARIKHG